MFKLAIKSLKKRLGSLFLLIFSLSCSILLFLGVERTSMVAKKNFTQSLSGTDLIVGARTGEINLLLYSLFHIGNSINNIGYDSYLSLAKNPDIDWIIPLSLGDSHKGYKVVGTSEELFKHYQYGHTQSLQFKSGNSSLKSPLNVILGSTVAEDLGYSLGSEIILSHGSGKQSIYKHENLLFKVSGILKQTGTPIDRSLYISLEGMTAIHVGWENGVPLAKLSKETILKRNLRPQTITSALVGLKNRGKTFVVQRKINNFKEEPLMAILPGQALYELWKIFSVFERALTFLTLFVFIVGLIGLITAQLSSLKQRSQELSVYRSIGAHPKDLFLLLFYESLIVTLSSCIIGSLLLFIIQGILSLILSSQGISIPLIFLTGKEFLLLLMTLALGGLAGFIPAILVYKGEKSAS